MFSGSAFFTMRFIILIVSFLFTHFVRGQNLVPNPSFEDTVQCPTYINQIHNATGWFNCNAGTPDYFNSCFDGTVNSPPDVPRNVVGIQYARTGEAYAGFGGYFADSGNCREYFGIRLTDSLRGGKRYCLEMYVAMADSLPLAVNKIGMYLSQTNDTMFYDQWGTPWCGRFPYVPVLQCDSIVKDSISWVRISGTITAQGGEQFLMIGVFATETELLVDTMYGNGFNAIGYYYVDDVSVVQCDTPQTVYSEFTFFPNPSNGNFNITGNFPPGSHLKIYNILGQEVSNTIYLPEGNANVPIYSFLAQGVYHCRITADGILLKEEKIAVVH